MYSLVIAEDELATRRALVNMVHWNELGFQVNGEFADGEELLEYLKSNVPDVILTDIDMSRVNGVEVAAYVAKEKLPTRVIFLTAYRDFSFAKSAVEYRVEHYLLKPISITELKTVFTTLREKLDEENAHAAAIRKSLELLEQMHGTGGQPEGEQMPKNESRRAIEKVMRYIREHYREDITLNGVAENVFLSPVYISRLIKEETGKNYVALIMELRIQRAVELLENTEMYVYEIAEHVGYSNLKYFYKVFKKVTGKSPNDYRK